MLSCHYYGKTAEMQTKAMLLVSATVTQQYLLIYRV